MDHRTASEPSLRRWSRVSRLAASKRALSEAIEAAENSIRRGSALLEQSQQKLKRISTLSSWTTERTDSIGSQTEGKCPIAQHGDPPALPSTWSVALEDDGKIEEDVYRDRDTDIRIGISPSQSRRASTDSAFEPPNTKNLHNENELDGENVQSHYDQPQGQTEVFATQNDEVLLEGVNMNHKRMGRMEPLVRGGSDFLARSSQIVKMPGFKYKPLKSATSIRLLRLYEAHDMDAPILCTMAEVGVPEKSTLYKALSYTWGHPERTRWITINGQPALITQNLHEALRYLRACGYCEVPWWIDAICVNQTDLRERSEQVANMRNIFREAEEVIAWLGPSYDNSDKVMDNIEAGRGFGQDIYSGPWIRSFLSRQYWSRLWTVQEVVVAENITLLCGNMKVSWSAYESSFGFWLSSLSELFMTRRELCSLRNRFHNPMIPPYGWENLPTMNRLKKTKGQPLLLTDLISATSSHMGSEPKDKIFALLGMVGRGHGIEIIPNYESSSCSVYCAAIRAMRTDALERDHLDQARYGFIVNDHTAFREEVLESCEHNPLDNDEISRSDCDGVSCSSRRICFEMLYIF